MSGRIGIVVFPLSITLGWMTPSCAPTEETLPPKDAKDVQLVKADPPTTCKDLGSVTAEAPSGTDAERSAKRSLREKAARMGANYVRWETLEISEDPPRATITGVAYLCPSAPDSPAEPVAPASK